MHAVHAFAKCSFIFPSATFDFFVYCYYTANLEHPVHPILFRGVAGVSGQWNFLSLVTC